MYIIFKQTVFRKQFLNKLELICLHTHDGFKLRYLTLIIVLNTNPLFCTQYKWFQVLLFNTNNSIPY